MSKCDDAREVARTLAEALRAARTFFSGREGYADWSGVTRQIDAALATYDAAAIRDEDNTPKDLSDAHV